MHKISKDRISFFEPEQSFEFSRPKKSAKTKND